MVACFLACSFASTSAWAAPSYHVELPEGLDRAAVLRAIALELRELTVPPHPERAGDSEQAVHLFVRVSPFEKVLLLELWDRGESAGSRRISPTGSSGVVARSIALSTVELMRGLSETRHRKAQRIREEKLAAEERERESAQEERRERTQFAAQLGALWYPDVAYLLGPEVWLQLNRDRPLRISLGAQYRQGEVIMAAGHSNLSGPSLEAQAGRVTRFKSGLEVETAGFLSLEALRIGATAHTGSGSDFLVSRFGLRLKALWDEPGFPSGSLGLAGGIALTNVRIYRDEETKQLGGGFLSASLGIVLDAP